MNLIPPHRLWVGHAGDGRDIVRLREVGIEVIVQLAIEEAPCVPPRDLVFMRFPLIDGTGNRPEMLDLAIRSVAHWIIHSVPILVSCGAGMSRSPAIAAAALSVLGQGSPEDCLAAVSQHRPTDVSPGLWETIRSRIESLKEFQSSEG